MAKSGQYISSKYSNAYSMIFDWAVVSQDVESNSSYISWTLTFKSNGSGTASSSCSVDFPDVINVYVDENLYTTNITYDWSVGAGQSKVLASGNTTIYHQSSGAQPFTFSFDAHWELAVSSTTNFGWSVGVQSDAIDYIVRSASLISVSPDSPTDENRYTINYSNPAGEYATLLQIGAEFSDGKIAFAAQDVDKVAGLTAFIPTDEDKNRLYNKLNEGYTEVTVKFFIRSTVPADTGSETVKSEFISKTINFVKYFPKLNPTVVEGNSDVRNLTGSDDTMVAGMSDAVFTTGAEAVKSAYIVKQYISNGDQQLDNASSGTLNAVTSNTFYFYVEDSRGNVTRDFKVVNWIPYVKPTCKVKTENITTDGKLTIYLSGKYFNGSFGAVSNSLYMDYKVYKDGEDVPETWNMKTLSPTVDEDNNYTQTVTLTGLEYDKRYRFIVKVFDELATSAETSGIVAAEPLFDWGKEDFRFYIPVQMDKGFMYPQWLLWQLPESPTETDITNALLGDGVEIPLDYPISSMPTGAVFVFSLYRDGVVEDVSITSHFKSRVELTVFPNAKHTFLMAINSNLSVFGAKYITIEDDKLTGFSGNTAAGEAVGSSIKFDNSKFVLRYVIGV